MFVLNGRRNGVVKEAEIRPCFEKVTGRYIIGSGPIGAGDGISAEGGVQSAD